MNIDTLFLEAKKQGFTDLQVFISGNKDLSIEVFEGELEKYEIAESSSMNIKGVYQGKMASYITEVFDDASIPEIIKKMIQNAGAIDSPDEPIIYAGDAHYVQLEGVYNKAFAEVDVLDKIDLVKKLDARVHQLDPRVKVVESFYSESTRNVTLHNTKGLKLNDQTNGAMFGAQVIVKDDSDQRTAFDLIISNELADFDIDTLSQDIVTQATQALGAKAVPSNDYDIIFKNDAFGTFLSAFQGVFSADNVQKGMSLLKGKLDTAIGSKHVTLVDDPFMKKGTSSRSFDDEGVATRYKELIAKGTLKTYLHNLLTARKDNVTSTGNGFAGAVTPTNLSLLPGEATLNDLFQTVQNGLYITEVQGAHSGANPISGDFSLQASGFVIENGTLRQPVALITVSGNFVTLLQDVKQVANDVKTSYFGITSPSVRVGKMSVSGL
jgi:PmbA protein